MASGLGRDRVSGRRPGLLALAGQEMADALDDDPRLARSGAGDDNQRPIAPLHDPALLVGQLALNASLGRLRLYHVDQRLLPGPLGRSQCLGYAPDPAEAS